MHFDGFNWSKEASVTTNGLNGVFGTGASDIYAVGNKGTILHYDGLKWSAENSGTGNHLLGVWAVNKHVFAVGYSGTIVYKCIK